MFEKITTLILIPSYKNYEKLQAYRKTSLGRPGKI
jgi:hypothetical protein